MTIFQDAIDDFRRRRLDVYRSDPDQVQRDVNVVAETVKDHIGRWPLELIQNCDDAESHMILIRFAADAIYVADRGTGVPATKIKSLSGTHFSDKPAGAIGRKGLGFKAVYEITTQPRVYTGEDDGLTYCQATAREELANELGIVNASRVPYEWLPFWVSRRDAAKSDPVLAELSDWNTVIHLPIDKKAVRLSDAFSLLGSLPSHVLLTFRHVQRLEVSHDAGSRLIESEPDATTPSLWHVRDSASGADARWKIIRGQFDAPETALADLEASDRERMATASVIVAAPVDASGVVTPASDYPRICVYYPVGEDEKSGRSPVPLLLHADFLVSSDRKHVLQHNYNDWLKGQLAGSIVSFVDACFDSSHPAANLRLLLPHSQHEAHPLAASLWCQVASEAKKRILLPDQSGQRRLPFNDARYISLAEAKIVRRIVQPDELAERLVHQDLEADSEAVQVLRVLGCGRITDEDVLTIIASTEVAVDAQWLWACWEWAAAWAVEKQPYDPAHAHRVEKLKQLPFIPINGNRWSPSKLGVNTVITWRDQQQHGAIPSWLPMRFVDDWFRDRLTALKPSHPVRALAKELGVREPDIDSSLQSLGIAIEEYWMQPSGDPQRFLQFLLDQDWHEQIDATPKVQRCPIQVALEAGPQDGWREARQSYFGMHWGNSAAASIYQGVADVAWAKTKAADTLRQKAVLEWLGVVTHPRVREGRLDRISPGELSAERAIALLSLIASNWDKYFSNTKRIEIQTRTRGGRVSISYAEAPWWNDLRNKLLPPLAASGVQGKPLQQCWLPDPATRQAAGPLLPAIDLDRLGADRAIIEPWLRQIVGLRTNIDQITHEEWRDLLTNRVRQLVDDNGAGQHRHEVQRWYEAALDSLSAQPHAQLGSVPLLCRKADAWEFRGANTTRWVEDSTEVADAFRDEIWTISLAARLHAQAKRLFRVSSLRESVNEEALYDLASAEVDSDRQQHLDAIKPFVFAWRCYKTKSDVATLRDRLARLSVRRLPSIEVRLTLPGHTSRTIVRPYHHQGYDLILRDADTEVVHLARAFAAALDLRSDANFVENLLRCKDDAERSAKLQAEEVPIDQIELRIREFAKKPEAESGRADGALFADSRHLGVASHLNAAQISRSASGTTSRPTSATDSSGTASKLAATTPAASLAGLRLKDSTVADYVVRSRMPEGEKRSGDHNDKGQQPRSAMGDGDRDSTDGEILSQHEKDQIEAAARGVVMRVLKERLGYAEVEEMSPDNKGFDIKATKDGVELRVEVKGHRGASHIAQVTDTQIRECERCSSSHGREIWQLWNVEHLAASDTQTVAITIVRWIPPEARKADRYRVDIRQCEIEPQH
jgi:hypothetical protein